MTSQTLFPPLEMAMTAAKLTAASCETVLHRMSMMVSGTCSLAEYQLMFDEKLAALQESCAALVAGKSQASIIEPFLNCATANAKRLRLAE